MTRAPLMNGYEIIGEVIADEEMTVTSDDQYLFILLNKQSGLVKELMKEELVYFDIVNIPAVRS